MFYPPVSSQRKMQILVDPQDLISILPATAEKSSSSRWSEAETSFAVLGIPDLLTPRPRAQALVFAHRTDCPE